MSRFRELAALTLAAASLLGGARADEGLTLARAVERALATDAEVAGAAAEVRAARARLGAASSPLAANPQLSAGVGRRSGDGGRTVDTELALSQPVEIAGQRGARVAAARAALGAAEARLSATRARVEAEVRALLARVVASRLRAELASEAQRLAERAAAAAERRHQAGDVARIEADSARLERGRAARARLEADQEGAAALAELELVLGVGPGTPLEPVFQLGSGLGAGGRSLEALAARALEARGDLAAARLELAAARAEARLAARSAVPTPELGVSYAREERAEVVLGTLSFELPLFSRNEGERGAASARVDRAAASLAALERRVVQEVRLAAGRVEAARSALASFDPGVIGAVDRNLAAAERAYEAGQLDFVRYLLLRREALEARRDRVDALEALDRAEAQLERALGGAGEPARG